MQLTNTTVYAIISILLIAKRKDGDPVSSKTLALEGGLPERFLMQVLRSLVVARILKSTRGVSGGYTLLRDPEEITVLEVIESTDGCISYGGSEVVSDLTSDELIADSLGQILDEATESIRQKLASFNIRQIVRMQKRKRSAA